MSDKPPPFRVWSGHPCVEDSTINLESAPAGAVRAGNIIQVHPDKRSDFEAAIENGLTFDDVPERTPFTF